MNFQQHPINNPETKPEKRLEAARSLARDFTPDLSARCEVDLHSHSFCSDGYNSPTGIVFDAWRRQMKAVAICDHDTIDGQLEALEAGRILNITVVPAVEFDTDVPGLEILAYFPDIPHFLTLLKRNAFAPACDPIKNAKQRQFQTMIEQIPARFAALGINADLTREDIHTHIRNGLSSTGDISVILWLKYKEQIKQSGIARDAKEFHAVFTTSSEHLHVPLEIEMDLSPAAWIRRISQWGGLSSLAHPTEILKKNPGLTADSINQLICELADQGLQALEVDGWRHTHCPRTGTHQTDQIDAIRLKYNAEHPDRPPLLFTNGSDTHGLPFEKLDLGCGRENNLRPEFGRYSNILQLLQRQKTLQTEPLT